MAFRSLTAKRVPHARLVAGKLLSLLTCLLIIGLATGCSTLEEAKKQEDVASSLQEADRLFTIGNVAQAQSWCDKAIALDPDSIATYLGYESGGFESPGVIGVLQQHGDYPDMIRYITAATKNPKFSNNWRLYLVLADAQTHMDNSAGEQEAYRQELAALAKQFTTSGATIDTGNIADLLSAKADAEWAIGDTASAMKDYSKAIETYPDRAPYVKNHEAYSAALTGTNLPEALALAKDAVSSARHSDDDTT